LTDLNAVTAAETTDSEKVIAELHKPKIDDLFTIPDNPGRQKL
jgi:hypothetical protein